MENGRVAVEGGPGAERRLVVRFGELVERLAALPDPDEAEVRRLLPGADLMRALMEEADSFGAAAPGTSAATPLAEQILALTDEAFAAAREILEGSDAFERYGEPPDPTLSVLMFRLDGGMVRSAARAIRHAPPAEDPSIGEEFV